MITVPSALGEAFGIYRNEVDLGEFALVLKHVVACQIFNLSEMNP